MIVALPIFGSEVSPRFDCAGKFLIARVDGGRIVEIQFFEIMESNPIRRASCLLERKVDRIICGGIDDFSTRILNGLGIQVVPWVSGNAQQVLENFLKYGRD